MRKSLWAALACSTVPLSGCASFTGAAHPVLAHKAQIAEVQTTYDEAVVYRAFHRPSDACSNNLTWPACRDDLDRKSYRNLVTGLYIGASDAAYNDFRTRLSYESKSSSFGGNVAVLLMNAVAVVSGDGARRALAAGSAFVSGSQATVDRDLLVGRTWTSLLTAMDSGRAAVKAEIITRMQQPAEAYSLEEALDDVRRLEGQATLTAALERVSRTVAADAEQQSVKLEAAYAVGLQGDLIDQKVGWLDEIEAMDDAGLQELARQFGATVKTVRGDQIAMLRGWIDQNVQTDAAFTERQAQSKFILSRARLRAEVAKLSDADLSRLTTSLSLQPGPDTKAARLAAMATWLDLTVQSATGEAQAVSALAALKPGT